MSRVKHERVKLESYPPSESREIEAFRVPDSDKVSVWLKEGWLSTSTQIKAAEARELAHLLLGVIAEIEGDGERSG